MAYYRGKYSPKNKHKYIGNNSLIIYRSSWELSMMIWLDNNPIVKSWVSEETIVPYYFNDKWHKYFVDFKVIFANGNTWLIELKPNAQTKLPEQPKRQTTKYLLECQMYIKNQCKWKAARQYAEERNWKFYVLTKQALKEMGVKII